MPRVQAIALGQTVRFTNQDGETHNVHVVSPGFAFNQSMAPDKPGLHAGPGRRDESWRVTFTITCGALWSSARRRGSQVCDRDGRFRLEDVPDGRYVLTVWHEMGEPVRTEHHRRGRQRIRAARNWCSRVRCRAEVRLAAAVDPRRGTAPCGRGPM